jgi:hypothetical protein
MPPAGIVRSAPCAQTRRDEHYDAATVWFHWSTVALVAILWTLGQVTGWLPRSPFRSGLCSDMMGFLLASSSRVSLPGSCTARSRMLREQALQGTRPPYWTCWHAVCRVGSVRRWSCIKYPNDIGGAAI